MKALVVTPYYHPKIGGLEIYAQQLNRALGERKGWDIVVVTSNHTGRRTVADTVDGNRVYRLGTWLKFSNTPLNPLWPLMIRSIIRRERPDIIVAHTPVPSMADAARLVAGKTPLVVAYHAATLLKGDSILFDTAARLYSRYERLLLGRANLILAVSDYVKQQFPMALHQKTKVIPNAVWEKDIVNRRQPQDAEFLFVGSLDKTHGWKGLQLIIEAVALCRQRYGDDCRLAVMGPGNDRPRYEQLVAQMGLNEAVTFLGSLSGAQKDAAFGRARAVVLYPTSANDAFPTVMLEAWARSVPVVAANIGPLPTLVHDGQDGYLVAPRDAEALAAKLHEVTRLSPAVRREVAARAAERTRQAYTWERQADAVAKLVEELV